jgi:hypothetical protein
MAIARMATTLSPVARTQTDEQLGELARAFEHREVAALRHDRLHD